ncbi:MAG: glucuronate isomerase [Planctomycetota bacterium]
MGKNKETMPLKHFTDDEEVPIMSVRSDLEKRLYDEIMSIPVIDVHSHVPHESPFASSLRDLLGYHYFTELAHSAGMDKEVIDEDNPDEQMLPELVNAMQTLDNTVQYEWMIELARELFDFQGRRLTEDNWQSLADAVEKKGRNAGREQEILDRASIEKVFLTNPFDDDLSTVNTDIFVPSLRADSLVFELEQEDVQESLQEVADTDISDAESLRGALGTVVSHFVDHGARSMALSLPPGFEVFPVVDSDLDTAVAKTMQGKPLSSEETETLRCGVLFALAELCRDHDLPVQLMYGVIRDAYRHGVPKGTDLPVAGDSLRGLLPLLNGFPGIDFCLSVLSDSQAQELASYGWILHNVIISGHWWYDTVPAYVQRDLAARIQSVPKTELIGYYSDMYKLEFGLPKYNMYRRILARVLAEDLIGSGRGTEKDAVEVARYLLRDNARRIFDI